MIETIVARALRLPALVFSLALIVVVGGLLAYHRLGIEAYPNPVPPLVEVIAQPSGYNADEVERFATTPIELAISGIRGLDHVRSQSLFELSDTKCYFDWSIDYDEARREVLARLSTTTLPAGVTATVSPWNAIGEIFRYTIEGDGYRSYELKAAQEFVLRRQFKHVAGVMDVTTFGGETKQYHVEVDPFRLSGQKVSLSQVTNALQDSNHNAGAQRVVIGTESYDVRAVGLLSDLHDIEDVVVGERNGTAVRVRQIANVGIGSAPRLGQVGQDDRPDVIEGIVLMRYGAETVATMDGVKERLQHVEDSHLLPPGMHVKPIYERAALVNVTTRTVTHNLLLGMGLVVLTLVVFLGNVRAGLVTALNIPLALCVAFIAFVATGSSANLISLGAIDFGIVIDSSVIMMENLVRHLGVEREGSIISRLSNAAREVATPMAFATAIITVAFLPLFTMTGVAGVIFAPLARMYAFAIGSAILFAVTLTPVLASKVLSLPIDEKDGPLMRLLRRIYDPLFDAGLRRPRLTLGLRAASIAACFVLPAVLGREFLPKLEEGNVWIRATLPTSISREEAARFADRMRAIVRGCPVDGPCTSTQRTYPEVLSVTSQVGRPDDGTDVTLFSNLELFAPLTPPENFRPGMTKDKLIADLRTDLEASFPGTAFGFSQMILDNVEEAVSGVKGESAVKVVGTSIEDDERVAHEIRDVLSTVRGVADLGLFPSLGQAAIRISPRRTASGRYGLNTGDVTEAVQTAIGGKAVTQVFEGEKFFDLTVRFTPDVRRSVDLIRAAPINTPDGPAIPLATIANVEVVTGTSTIYRQDGERYLPVKFSVRGRDLAGTIADAKAEIAHRVQLPYGVHLDWAGEIDELRRAEARLAIVIPITLLLIALLTYGAVRNWLDTALVLLDLPVAIAGGLLALVVTGTHLSVSAMMGFVSIFGVSVQDSLLIATYFQRLRAERSIGVEQAAREAAQKRLRAVLMTAVVATLGLLPAALSNGIGAQTQKPLAIVVIGGALSIAVIVRIVQPSTRTLAYAWRDRRRPRAEAEGEGEGEGEG